MDFIARLLASYPRHVAVAAQGVRPAFSRHGASGKQAAQDFDDCQLEAVSTAPKLLSSNGMAATSSHSMCTGRSGTDQGV